MVASARGVRKGVLRTDPGCRHPRAIVVSAGSIPACLANTVITPTEEASSDDPEGPGGHGYLGIGRPGGAGGCGPREGPRRRAARAVRARLRPVGGRREPEEG